MQNKFFRTVGLLAVLGMLGLGSVALHSQVAVLSEFWVEGEILALASDLDGNSVVAVNINNNHRVVKYDSEGNVLTSWSIADEPRGLAVDASGVIHVVAVNINNSHRVVKYTSEGEFIAEWFGEGVPTGIAVDPEGNSVVAVNINNNHKVVKYSAF